MNSTRFLAPSEVQSRFSVVGCGRWRFRFVVQAERLIGVLHELMHRERAVVRLDDRVRDLRRRHDRERQHHAVRVLLADLGDQKRAHASAGAAAEGVRDPGGEFVRGCIRIFRYERQQDYLN